MSRSYLIVEPHKDLLRQIGEISRVFENNDLVLVDQQATGNGWSMMAGPLDSIFGKQAVYFLNPDDLAKIDQQKFDRIYLIIPDKNLPLYEESPLWKRMRPFKNYQIENILVESNIYSKSEAYATDVTLPLPQALTTSGKIYLYEKL